MVLVEVLSDFRGQFLNDLLSLLVRGLVLVVHVFQVLENSLLDLGRNFSLPHIVDDDIMLPLEFD